MRTQTAREKAEAHVALIRHEYPNPVSYTKRPSGDRYCVYDAAVLYVQTHSGIMPGQSGIIAQLNDASRFEEAWGALTDYYESEFSQHSHE